MKKWRVTTAANFAPSLMREVVNLYLDRQIKKSKVLHQRVYDVTNYLNHQDEELTENRLASRIAQFHLLGIIDNLSVSLTEAELEQIGEGLIKNQIPNVFFIEDSIKLKTPFDVKNYKEKIRNLSKVNYFENGLLSNNKNYY